MRAVCCVSRILARMLSTAEPKRPVLLRATVYPLATDAADNSEGFLSATAVAGFGDLNV
jgi:hypothetical protein